jgi:hypothetical protein
MAELGHVLGDKIPVVRVYHFNWLYLLMERIVPRRFFLFKE